jgi:hypothetical protein
MKLSFDMIDQNRTEFGGWTMAQMAALGVSWPPRHGWLTKLIGTEIPDEQWQKFLDGRFIPAEEFKKMRKLERVNPNNRVEIDKFSLRLCGQLVEHLGRNDAPGFATTMKAYGKLFKISVDVAK